ncbi:MAG: hypothetical protein GC179_01235 [Anaerolineaceae bacterium]|nr:hypothetical protein [Anaerolineaceae bacterium]
MPVNVEKLPNLPVIVLTYEGHMDVETVKSAFTQSVVIAVTIDGIVYRISDVRKGEGSFADVVNIIKSIRESALGSSADPKIKGVFVGGHQLARMYADFLKQEQFGSTAIPFFQTLEEALEYIELDRKQQG